VKCLILTLELNGAPMRDEFPADNTRAGDSDGDGVDDLFDDFPDNPNASDASNLSIGPGVQELVGVGRAPGDQLGFDLAVDGALMVAGAPGAGSSGSAQTGLANSCAPGSSGPRRTAAGVTGGGAGRTPVAPDRLRL